MYTIRLRSAATHLLEYLLLLGVLMAAILYLAQPWWDYFATGLADHWDPLLMGSWMAFNAQNILDGRFLIPDFNANLFYPHAYTLAFSEPLWPQSFVYAVVYALSDNPYLAFNWTFLLFWALSGLCMFALLRTLDVPRWIGYLGAIAFCVMPYRLAYYVEFNMTLVFGIPLAYLFLIRWLRSQTVGAAAGFALVFWLSAISCLYYTIIMTVPLLFLLLAYVAHRPRMLGDPRFWRTGLAAIAIITVSCGIYLYPYAVLRIDGGYVRTLAEQAVHSAQALNYIQPVGVSDAHRWMLVPAHPVETDLFPGLLLAGLFGLYLWRTRIVLRSAVAAPRWSVGLAWGRAALWLVFWSVLYLAAWSADSLAFRVLSWAVVPALLGVFGVSVGLHLRRRFQNDTAVVVSGLALGALAAFMLSLGPQITAGMGENIVTLGRGPMEAIYRLVPVFGVIRVTSRFAIVVLTFMTVAGCVGLASFTQLRNKLSWLSIPLVALAIAEVRTSGDYDFVDYSDIAGSSVQARLRGTPERIALLQIPMGQEYIDSVALQNSVGKFDFLLNGYSGFVPGEHLQLALDIHAGRVGGVTRRLRKLWPAVHIVVDLKAHRWWRHFGGMVFQERQLLGAWRLVDQDERYHLYRLKRVTEREHEITRRLRTDVLRRNPVFSFSARPAGRTSANLWYAVTVNGHEVSRARLQPGWRPYAVTIPERVTGRIRGEEVVLALVDADNGTGWEIRDIGFSPQAP